jgi:hypothetical protein
MRRFVISVTVGVLGLIATQKGAWAGASLILGEDITAQNCAAIVTLKLAGSNGLVGGAQVDLLVPDAPFNVPDPSAACVLDPGLSGGVSTEVVSNPPPPSGMLRLRVIVRGNDLYADGPLATCYLSTVSGAPQGEYTVVADLPRVAHPGGSLIGAAGLDGLLTVAAPTFCCP